MKDGLIERIKTKGYWRVNFRPRAFPVEPLALERCRHLVEQSNVRLRGWDYPHVSTRNDDEGSFEYCGNYVESWTDWGHHPEFWRFFKSTQFLHYRAIAEDWVDGDDNRRRPSGPHISVTGAIYSITEILEFLFRLHRNGAYESGAQVNISIENSAQRELWISDPMRMPFSYPRATGAQRVVLNRELASDDLKRSSPELSIMLCQEFFDNFGWQPDPNQIIADREKLLSRRMDLYY